MIAPAKLAGLFVTLVAGVSAPMPRASRSTPRPVLSWSASTKSYGHPPAAAGLKQRVAIEARTKREGHLWWFGVPPAEQSERSRYTSTIGTARPL
jgi:hypothetical protein